MSGVKLLYVPALRMKSGELQGLRDLAPDIADSILPRMIVPPVCERDEALQGALFVEGALPDVGGPLKAHWPERDVLIEATHLVAEAGDDKVELWLPKMFERARVARARPVPLVQLRDLRSPEVTAYSACVDRAAKLQFGLVMSSGDIENREALARAIGMLDFMRIAPDRCAIIVDFHDADLSTPELVAPIIGAALEELQLAAPWQHVIFQGTNYPDKNPAQEGSEYLVPRNEWISWRKAIAFDPGTAAYLLFGDYAADCAKIKFGEARAGAIPHYRYTTPDAWLVQRGLSTGRHLEVMRDVCKRIVDSDYFAGRDFSSADDYIFQTAGGRAGPGNSTTWRAINTTHHITRVVRDVGKVRGRAFAYSKSAPDDQLQLI